MSSTKLKLHNVSQQRRWRWTEPRPQATCTKDLVKIKRVVLEISLQTDRHTYQDMLITILGNCSRGQSSYFITNLMALNGL